MPMSPDDDPPDDPLPEGAIDRAAAVDDLFGGFASPADGGDPPGGVDDAAGDAVPGLIDTMLLLRQMAAADGVVPAAAARPAPRSIGRHAILRLAGEGGFATVWEGFDTVLRRPVAVKVRRPEALLSETARRRFVREAEIAAQLVHPNIITIFEVGEDQGREFIAAEFCSGGSLASWLERHPTLLPPRVAARLVRALAGAVAYAHEMGVVHRDIKPANVLLAPALAGIEAILFEPCAAESERGLTVKLGDFGLGKLQDDVDAGDALTQLTRTGQHVGTPAWMAPEQLDRSFGPVGPATDVHALGLLLDQLLTGRPLRSGGTTAETYRQVLFDEATPADRVASGVSRDLAAVAVKCLAKRPADRYPSAASLAEDLDRWLAGRPTIARPLSPAGRMCRWVRVQPVVVVLALAVVTASLVAVWAGVSRGREARQAAARGDEIRRRQAVTELRRGFEAFRAGNVAGALGQLQATRDDDPGLAGSLAGRWLLRRTHGERAVLLRPESGDSAAGAPRPSDLYAIAIAPGGGTGAVAAADGAIRLIQGLDRTPETASYSAHDEVNDVSFSADGTRLVSAGQDGLLRWWDVKHSGLEAVGKTDPGAGPLYAAAFAPDGRAIACGGADRRLWLVRLEAPDRPVEVFRFKAAPEKSPEVESIVFLRDGTIGAVCGDQIVMVDAATGRLVREFERPFADHHNTVLGSLSISPDGDRIIACGTDTRAHIWEIETGRIVTSLPAHPAWVQGCCFVGDGDRVATACRDGGLRIFDARSGAPLGRLAGHVGRVWSVVGEPAGTLLSCGADGTVRRWDPHDRLETAGLRSIPVDGGEVRDIAECPEFRAAPGRGLFVAVPPLGTLTVDIAGGSSRGIGREDGSVPVILAVDRIRGRLAVSWRKQGPIRVFDLADASSREPTAGDPAGEAVELPAGFDPSMAHCSWTARGELLVGSRDGKLCLLSANLSAAVPIAALLEDPVQALAVAPAGLPRVAAAGKHSVILPLPGGPPAARPVAVPLGEESSAVAWSPDAKLVAFSTRTGRVLLVDPVSAAVRGELVPHQRGVVTMAFASAGRLLLSADQDCVRITEVATLTTLDEIRPGWHVKAMRLLADEGCLAIGGHADSIDPGAARLAVMELDRP